MVFVSIPWVFIRVKTETIFRSLCENDSSMWSVFSSACESWVKLYRILKCRGSNFDIYKSFVFNQTFLWINFVQYLIRKSFARQNKSVNLIVLQKLRRNLKIKIKRRINSKTRKSKKRKSGPSFQSQTKNERIRRT